MCYNNDHAYRNKGRINRIMDIQTEMNQMYGQLGISAQVLEYGRRVEET